MDVPRVAAFGNTQKTRMNKDELKESEKQIKADIALYIRGITWPSRQLLWAGKEEIIEHLCQLVSNNLKKISK